MRKIWAILCILLFGILTPAAAYELPRWQFFPVSVSVQNHEKAALVKRAFSEWENKTQTAKFLFVNPAKRNPSITVRILDINNTSSTSSSYAERLEAIETGEYKKSFQSQFYYKTNITIYTSKPNSSTPLTDEEIYETALHEIGHALGLRHSSNRNDVMYPTFQQTNKHLSTGDIKAFNSVYKP